MTTIGYLGPKGTYTQSALTNYIESLDVPPTVVEKITIPDLFDAIESGECDQIIIPFENSIEGSVNISLDLLSRSKSCLITKEITLSIEHAIATKQETNTQDISDIISHPQALAQCQHYIRTHYPNAHLHTVSSTAFAAQCVAENNPEYLTKEGGTLACIGNPIIGDLYQLHLLDTQINDYPNNSTRFVVLSQTKAKKTGNDKTTLLFATLNEPGGLVSILTEFDKRTINLTRISSRPSKKYLGEYNFIIDIEGHSDDEHIKETIQALTPKTTYLKLLGSYERG